MNRKLFCSLALISLLAGCGGNCGNQFISDYNSAFAYPGTRARQCELVRQFKAKWAGTVCSAQIGDIQKSKTTINANNVADNVLAGCN